MHSPNEKEWSTPEPFQYSDLALDATPPPIIMPNKKSLLQASSKLHAQLKHKSKDAKDAVNTSVPEADAAGTQSSALKASAVPSADGGSEAELASKSAGRAPQADVPASQQGGCLERFADMSLAVHERHEVVAGDQGHFHAGLPEGGRAPEDAAAEVTDEPVEVVSHAVVLEEALSAGDVLSEKVPKEMICEDAVVDAQVAVASDPEPDLGVSVPPVVPAHVVASERAVEPGADPEPPVVVDLVASQSAVVPAIPEPPMVVAAVVASGSAVAADPVPLQPLPASEDQAKPKEKKARKPHSQGPMFKAMREFIGKLQEEGFSYKEGQQRWKTSQQRQDIVSAMSESERKRRRF